MFVAVDVSLDTRIRAKKLVERLRKAGVEARWTEEEHLHITLKFLGEVSSNRSMEICRAVERAAGRCEPFSFSCLGAGGYPNSERPRVLWMGVSDGREEFRSLQNDVEEELADIGFRPESRTFTPHLSIGRMRRARDEVSNVGEILAELSDFDGGDTLVDELVLYASELDRRHGPSYSVLGRVDIRGDEATS